MFKVGHTAVWSVITDKGDVAGLSYRDPNIVETLERYDGQVEYLENFNLSEAEFEKNLIGTFSTIDRPLSAAQKASRLRVTSRI